MNGQGWYKLELPCLGGIKHNLFLKNYPNCFLNWVAKAALF